FWPAAAPGRRWPTPADAADLVAGGLGERLRANRSGGLAAGARLAASLSLVAAVVLAGVWLLWIEIEPMRGRGRGADRFVGPGAVPVARRVRLAGLAGSGIRERRATGPADPADRAGRDPT